MARRLVAFHRDGSCLWEMGATSTGSSRCVASDAFGQSHTGDRSSEIRAPSAADPDVARWPWSAETDPVGVRNYLFEGVSGTGKTSVCRELNRRGYRAVNGDRDLAYQGDPETGDVTDTARHENHIWDVIRVQALVADNHDPVTFFCGGSRNFSKFIDLFDEVFVLDVDIDTLQRRLGQRQQDEWGAQPPQRDLIMRLHTTKEDIPRTGVVIDAARPLGQVVDEILGLAGMLRES